MMINSAPALILAAMIGKPEPGVDDVAAADAMIAGCGVGASVTEGVAEGVSSVLYGSRDPVATNGAAVGNPPGIQAGR